jgi:cold shock CspA family protein
MEGTIWQIYPRQEKGMICGDDGYQLPFRKSTLNGVEFLSLFSGLRVSYLIQEGWLGREAVNVHPVPVDRTRTNGEANV